MNNTFSDIYDFVLQQESAFMTHIPVYDDWEWNFKEHLKTSVFYKYGRLLTGNSEDKPIKNIVRPILNLAYRAEDIDVKDVHIYVDDPLNYHLSFLIKKYHDEVFVRENKLDDFFDEVKEEKIDFGGALVEKVNGAMPRKVPLQSIAFCDQSNIMGAPFGIKMSMSMSELLEMQERGWGDKKNGATISISDLVELMQYQKEKSKGTERAVQTPGKYCDVYKVWGVMPNSFIGKGDGYSLQLHFITFLQSQKENKKQGLTFFNAQDKDKDRFKFVNRDEIYGRSVGLGGVEELFEAQVWTNYSMIRKKDFLDAASKVIMQTSDSALAARHPSGLKSLDNMEILEHEEGKPLSQVDTFPRNYQLFNSAVNEWEEYAQRIGAATDPLLGESPPSGTPFRLQERVVMEGKGLHEYRKEKYARFIEEIYQDWIIPHIAREITRGVKFLAELSSDELEFIANNLVIRETNKMVLEQVLNGELPDPAAIEQLKQQTREQFMAGGNKRFIEILKNEMRDAPLKVKVNISGAQKDLSGAVEKLTNIFRQVFANPAVLDDPRAQKVFSKIIEYSGLSPIDFSSFGPKTNQQAVPQETVLPGVQSATLSPVAQPV